MMTYLAKAEKGRAMSARELVEELTRELERAETAIENLVYVLRQHGLYERCGLANQVFDRQKNISDLGTRARAWLEEDFPDSLRTTTEQDPPNSSQKGAR